MTYHSFAFMVGVKLNTSHQELVLWKTCNADFLLFSVLSLKKNSFVLFMDEFNAMSSQVRLYMPVCVSRYEWDGRLFVCVRPTGPSRSPPLFSLLFWTNARDSPSPGSHKHFNIQLCRHTEFLMQSSPGGNNTPYSLWFEIEWGRNHIFFALGYAITSPSFCLLITTYVQNVYPLKNCTEPFSQKLPPCNLLLS